MTCPAGVGPEFAVPLPPMLRIKGPVQKAWPYGSCAQGANNGLAKDTTTGDLWADPGYWAGIRDYTVNNNSIQVADPPNLPMRVWVPMADQPFTITNPFNVSMQAMVWTRMWMIAADYSGHGGVRITAWHEVASAPADPSTWAQYAFGTNQSNFDPNLQMAMEANVTINLNLPANGSVVLHRQQAIWTDSTYSGGSDIFVNQYGAMTTGFMFSAPSPRYP